MLTGNRGNNTNDNKQNVNTKGKQFMNKDGFCPSTLIVSFWNENISIKMHPALPENRQTESTRYDYNQTIMTSLSLEKAMTLLKKMNDVIDVALDNKVCSSVAILISSNNLIHVGSGLKGEIKPFIAIHKGLDPQTKIPTESLYYEFNTNMGYTIDDYNPETGEYTTKDLIYNEYFLFKEILLESIRSLCNAGVHTDRVVNKMYKDKIVNDLNEIGGKLGLTLKKEYNNSGGYQKNNGISFGQNNQSYTPPSNTGVPVNNISNLDDIDSFLN